MTTDESETHATTRIRLDYSVPLWGVLCVLGAGLLTLFAMYFTGLQTQKAVEELQIIVKSGNSSVAVLNSEVYLLKFRVDGNDAAIKQLQSNQHSHK